MNTKMWLEYLTAIGTSVLAYHLLIKLLQKGETPSKPKTEAAPPRVRNRGQSACTRKPPPAAPPPPSSRMSILPWFKETKPDPWMFSHENTQLRTMLHTAVDISPVQNEDFTKQAIKHYISSLDNEALCLLNPIILPIAIRISPLMDAIKARALSDKRVLSTYFWACLVESDVHADQRPRAFSSSIPSADPSSQRNPTISTPFSSLNPPTGQQWDEGVEESHRNFYEDYRKAADGFRAVDKQFVGKQEKFINTLKQISIHMQNSKKSEAQNNLKLMVKSCQSANKFHFPVVSPLHLNITLADVLPEKCHVFSSKIRPIRVTFLTTTGAEYPVIFKQGEDDLRQDAAIQSLIAMMTKHVAETALLKPQPMPYAVLPTSARAGLIECVDNACTLHDIQNEYKSIVDFFTAKAGPGQLGEAETNFLDSCALYTVMTYLLGIGDRHLENLMLTYDGYFFHIDFGFILGEQPPLKGKSSPTRVTKDMLEVFGKHGLHKFIDKCGDVYVRLRQLHDPIKRMFLAIGKNSEKDRQTLRERFAVSLTDREASDYMVDVIRKSSNSLFDVVCDRIHSIKH